MKWGRPSIRVKLTITSKDDNQFSSHGTFENMMDASMATGLTDRGIRMAYNSSRELMRKRSGAICCFKWEEPDPIPVTPPRTCLLPEGVYLTIFTSICQASRETDLSICALRNACEKANMSITRRKGERQTYRFSWPGKCKSCAC